MIGQLPHVSFSWTWQPAGSLTHVKVSRKFRPGEMVAMRLMRIVSVLYREALRVLV